MSSPAWSPQNHISFQSKNLRFSFKNLDLYIKIAQKSSKTPLITAMIQSHYNDFSILHAPIHRLKYRIRDFKFNIHDF